MCAGKHIPHLPEQSITSLMTGTTSGHLKQVFTVILLSRRVRLVLTPMPGRWGHRIQSRATPAHPHDHLVPLCPSASSPSVRAASSRGQSANPLPSQRTWPVISDPSSAASADEEELVRDCVQCDAPAGIHDDVDCAHNDGNSKMESS
jgi:hypothetical protein